MHIYVYDIGWVRESKEATIYKEYEAETNAINTAIRTTRAKTVSYPQCKHFSQDHIHKYLVKYSTCKAVSILSPRCQQQQAW